MALDTLRAHSWIRRTDASGLALHPLQQDFLRRRPGAAARQREVRQALVEASSAALPPVAPFGRWPADGPGAAATPAALQGPSTSRVAQPLLSASVLGEALEYQLVHAGIEVLCDWVDRVVAWLWATDRLAEAAAVLERAGRREDLPVWRRVGWAMQRAQALNTLGDGLASLQVYEAALDPLGLAAASREGSRWFDVAGSLGAAWRMSAWPPQGPQRRAFASVVGRAQMMYTQLLSFTPEMDRSLRANLVAAAVAWRAAGRAERLAVRVMSAYGATSTGRAGVGRLLMRQVRRRPAVCDDPVIEAFTREGECATRIALGQWDGVAEELLELFEVMARLGDHRHAMECHSLLAKLYFYQGRLTGAATRFAECTERSLRRPGGSWRAWGPFGQAEVALCLGTTPTAQLRRWVDLGSHWLTEHVNLDAAYALRRFGLMARLAWREGDVVAGREQVLGGVAAATRIAHCGFWAHEGLVGLGEGLLALHAHERTHGGVLGPVDAAWRAFDRRLAQHQAAFPAGGAMIWRLRGEWAHACGRSAEARQLLMRAVREAESQGLRVELARSCGALERLEPSLSFGERARQLWAEMGARQAVGPLSRPP